MKKENPSTDFVKLEKEILEFWEREKCFEKLVEKNKNGKRFRFLDGPITANNPMGIHHAWGRTLKDMYIKYNSMQGKSCQFQNGFDAQGLWVEVEVEKELGVKTKRDIVEYGMDKFTDKCMARVKKFSGVITEQSKRLGQWMDWENSYFTNTDLNITSIWHFLKVCYEKGWLVKSYRPMPWCPRCGTSLSEHEMSGSYKEVTHTSIYSKLQIDGTNDCMILWTTTPWTLTANVALAVNPELDYVRVAVKSDSRKMIVGKNALKKLAGDIVTVEAEFKGSELIGKTYETCFPNLSVQNFVHKIIPWDAVDAEEGTGIVHIAPGCGAEDFELGKEFDLPMICPIDEEGVILPEYAEFGGKSTVDVKTDVIAALEKAGKLYKTEEYTHSYPYCWRCKTDVVFKLVEEWSIKTDEIRPLLIAAAKTVKWEPEFAGKRMLDWLNNMHDWTISRKRFYGLPLPFYECKKCGHLTVVGSREELKNLAVEGDVDAIPHLHRPYIDQIKIKCPHCGETVARVPEVGDCWLDAGITPFSTKKYFSDKKYFEENFPSELVLEMKEQLRLWFYSLLFMSVTLTGKAPYEKVVTHSSVVNEEGGKFSKTGYMIRFDEAAEKIGADPVRYLYASAPVGADVRFGYNLTDEARRKIIAFWNVYVFFNLYASIDNPDVAGRTPDFSKLTHSDKWLIARTDKFLKIAKQAMDDCRSAVLIKEFEAYTDEVSNWYIRINRKRFWKSTDVPDKLNAYWCLYRAIKTTVGIMAPIIPFITDHIWQNTVRELEKDAPISVHLSDYPTPIANGEFDEYLAETDAAREVIALAQRMRNEASIKIKQPLAALYVTADDEKVALISALTQVVKDELNVKEVKFLKDDSVYNEPYFTVNFRVAGQVLKGDAQKLKKLIDGQSREEHVKLDAAYQSGKFSIGEFSDLDASLLDRHARPKANFVVSSENGLTLALDTALTRDLIEEGAMRELVRQIQVMRKDAGFAVEQRITASFKPEGELATAVITKFTDKIAEDILASSVAADIPDPTVSREVELSEGKVIVKLK